MSPKRIIEKWVDAFNAHDSVALESLYAEDALNHQMPNEAVRGKTRIGQMFRNEFAAAPAMHCIPVQIIEEGEWAVLEWIDPKGLRGCGFFHVVNSLIVNQRGYWDKLSFTKLYSPTDV
jgi:limonene-1,2-epoxide hydrolase